MLTTEVKEKCNCDNNNQLKLLTFRCWSYVGRIGGRQQISIRNKGCAVKGIVEHEIFHALGRFHEQSRPDRNYYIDIDSSNITPDGMLALHNQNTNKINKV